MINAPQINIRSILYPQPIIIPPTQDCLAFSDEYTSPEAAIEHEPLSLFAQFPVGMAITAATCLCSDGTAGPTEHGPFFVRHFVRHVQFTDGCSASAADVFPHRVRVWHRLCNCHKSLLSASSPAVLSLSHPEGMC